MRELTIENQSKKMLEETAIYVYLYISSSTIPETEDLIAFNPGLIIMNNSFSMHELSAINFHYPLSNIH